MKKNLVRGYRSVLGISQSDMAKKLGMSTNTYADKENGKRFFTDIEMLKFKDLLRSRGIKVEVQDIFFNDKLQKLQI